MRGRFFPDGKAIGHTITAGFAAFGPCAIVGVVNHVKYAGLLDGGPANQSQAYYSLEQVPDEWVPANYSDASVVVCTPLDTANLFPAITASVYQAGSDQPIYDVQTMHQIIANSMSEQRFPMILLAGFAGLALMLASVGVYGMISHSVTQRVQEIGIRMALGANRACGLLYSAAPGGQSGPYRCAVARVNKDVPKPFVFGSSMTKRRHGSA